jgi:hypothetical protein
MAHWTTLTDADGNEHRGLDVTDLMGAIGSTRSAMDEIEAIVHMFREEEAAPTHLSTVAFDMMAMGRELNTYAERNGHTREWVAKKAHEVIRQISWERLDRDLNSVMGHGPDFVG